MDPNHNVPGTLNPSPGATDHEYMVTALRLPFLPRSATLRPGVRRLRRFAALGAVVLAVGGLTWAPPVSAESSYTFTGGGYGHGVGLSQYGACGMAQSGSNYVQILTHYYSGTTVSTVAEPSNLRVLVAETGTLQLTVPAGSVISGVGSVSSTRNVTVRRSGSHAVLTGGVSATLPLPVTINPNGAMDISPPGHAFARGWLVIRPDDSASSLRAIVEGLSTRDYLLGLGEVSASWPMAAIQAQATAARTMAVTKDAHPRSAVYDLSAMSDGAYIGHDMQAISGKYWARWVSAIDSTAGKVVTYHGVPINSPVYSSSSGGRTASNVDVWGSVQVPYLRSVADPGDSGCRNKRHTWARTFGASELGSRLGMAPVTAIRATGPASQSGRTAKTGFVVTDRTGRTKSFDGADLRWALGLYSTKFTINGVALTTGGAAYRPPSGAITSIRAWQGRNILVAGRATDPDGTPRLFVADEVHGRVTWHVFPTAGGMFLAAIPASPGEHTTCIAVLDTPTGTATTIGCRNTVVK